MADQANSEPGSTLTAMLPAVIDGIHRTGANGHQGRLMIRALSDHLTAESARAAFDKESAT